MGFLTVLSVICTYILTVSCRDVVFINVPSVFGDQDDKATQEYYSEACRNCSLSGTGMYYSHENACNMYIYCIPFGSKWILFGYVAPRGAVFNERRLYLDNIFDLGTQTPNRRSCGRVGHPCDTGKMIPVNGDACSGYQMCINNRMVQRTCSNPYTGFNAMTQSCDLPCNRRQRTLIRQRCEANPTSRDYYYNYQTVKYSDESFEKIEFFNLRCTLGYKYLDDTKCVCQPYNETRKPCETSSVVYLDSEDDTWRLALNNSSPRNASALTGNATFVRTPSGYAPQFNGDYVLTAPMIRGNDLGLYFDMTLTFQSFRADQRSRGLTYPFSGTREIALADNSACDIDASYGCQLLAEADDRGRVVCSVKPNAETDHPDNKAVSSQSLDLRNEIQVYFAKNDTYGILQVRAGRTEDTKRITFNPGVRALGNECPLSIGAGKDKQFFKGMMTKMIMKKYCGPFM